MPQPLRAVRATCWQAAAAAILAAMTNDSIDLETLRQGARLAGFSWSDAELEEIRPQVEAVRRMLHTFDTVLTDDTEPATHYRTV
jgi:hypothetical protein